MKVVFFEDVEGTAQVGDVKDVKNGFARNFLLPRRIAGPVTSTNLQHANSLAYKEARRQEARDAEARVHADKLDGATITMEARVGETGRLFGSVTNRDIAAQIKQEKNVEIEPHWVLLAEPLRELGAAVLTVKFTRNVSAGITVTVVPDEESKPVVERLRAEQAAREEEEAKRRAEAAYERGETPDATDTATIHGESPDAEEAEEEAATQG